MFLYTRDGQLKVTSGPLLSTLKSSGPQCIGESKKKRSFKFTNIYFLRFLADIFKIITTKYENNSIIKLYEVI